MKDLKISNYHHQPVLLSEVLKLLNPKPGEVFIDATLGGGGYSKAILEKIKPDGKLLSIDLDPAALENARSQISNAAGWQTAHGNFRDIDKLVDRHKFPAPNGIVADLGLSSYELDQAGRGISFEKEELLDMRFDPTSKDANAEFILNNYDYSQLLKIFKDYGEDKFSNQIAKSIIKYRETDKLKYTTQLFQIIESALPKPVRHKAKDSARRIFQALRIEVNHELDNLQELLQKGFDILTPGGRMAIVSFHSLEDRIVKQFFAELNKGCICPPDFPQCLCGRNPKANILTKKPIVASEEEIKINRRSKPAKLRAIQKI